MKVNIILGSACNLKCKNCIQRGIKFDNSKVNIDAFCNKLVTSIYPIDGISFGGGEPLLYLKYIKKIVEAASCHSIITTNGTLIDDDYVSFANSNDIFTVISLYGQALPKCFTSLNRLSYSYVVTGALDESILMKTDKLIFFNIQHNVDGISYISEKDIDAFLQSVEKSNYLKAKFRQWFEYVLSRKKPLPNCFNETTVNIDLHFNKYLCFRKLDSKIGHLNDIIAFHHPYYSNTCQSCSIRNICKGGCIVSNTPNIECYWMKKCYDYFQWL